MTIDWSLVAMIATPVVSLVAGAAIDRFLERRPNLVAYYTHASAFRLPGDQPGQVFTHGIAIKNVGRQTATDIRVGHHYLPTFNVFPDVAHEVRDMPGGSKEIVFPSLVPGEQVYLSYLYLPPVVYSQIHAPIRHSAGFARELTVLPTPQYPRWLRTLLGGIIITGIVAILYVAFEVGSAFIGHR